MLPEDRDILDRFIAVMPLVCEMFIYDIGVTITDRERYLLYRPAQSLDLRLRKGRR